MNVCALDVVARSADFETVAATMEMRAWEWNFLHDIDGETALGEIARQRGVDLDSAIGLINDAMQRGLVVIPTVTLQAYRSHTAPQTSLRGTSPAVSLGSSALADKGTAVEAVRRGAHGFLLKPFTSETLATEITEMFVE
jgi:CheY-like chemotaxis protein